MVVKWNNQRGFSVVEVVITLVIIIILGAFAVKKYQKGVAFNVLEKAANSYYQELRGVRSTALRYDARLWITFSASQCSLFVDTSGDTTLQQNEFIRSYNISRPVTLGIASDGPVNAPSGIDWSATGIAGNWKTTPLTVYNDAIGTITSGAIYLMSPHLSRITYCIGILDGMHTMKLFKWDGSSWNAL